MCTPSQVTKYLSIYLFLTQLSRHHMILIFLFDNPCLIRLFTSTRLIRIFTAFSLLHFLVFHIIFLDVPWFLIKVLRKTARSLWISFRSPTLWSSPLALDKQSWGFLRRISSSSARYSETSVWHLLTLRSSYHTWWWSPSGHNLMEVKSVTE